MNDDLISRQAALDALKGCYCGGEDSCGEPWIYEDNAIKAVEQLPPIQPKRGKWTADNACSECGCQPWFWRDIHNYNFCPNCGADMRGEQE